MFDFEQNIADWRQLLVNQGAVFDNVTFKSGQAGVSIHVLDPHKHYRIFLPTSLLLPVDRLQFNEDGYLLDKTGLSDVMTQMWHQIFDFVLSEQRIDQLLSIQHQLCDLPAAVLAKLTAITMSVSPKWTRAQARARLIMSRYIFIDGKYYLMPVLDFANHSPDSKGFEVTTEGVGVSDTAHDEVCVNYSHGDAFHFYFLYLFPAKVYSAYSIGLTFGFLGKKIELHRNYLQMKRAANQCPIPSFHVTDDKIQVDGILLGSARLNAVVMSSFQQAFSDAGLPSQHAYEFFTAVYKANVNWCIALLKDLQGVEGLAADWLRQTTYQHLALMAEH